MKHKLLTFLTILLLLSILTACGGGSGDSNTVKPVSNTIECRTDTLTSCTEAGNDNATCIVHADLMCGK